MTNVTDWSDAFDTACADQTPVDWWDDGMQEPCDCDECRPEQDAVTLEFYHHNDDNT